MKIYTTGPREVNNFIQHVLCEWFNEKYPVGSFIYVAIDKSKILLTKVSEPARTIGKGSIAIFKARGVPGFVTHDKVFISNFINDRLMPIIEMMHERVIFIGFDEVEKLSQRPVYPINIIDETEEWEPKPPTPQRNQELINKILNEGY